MKLIYCPECLDVKKVRMLKVRHCACGKSWGYYLDDDLTAVVGGLAVPLAIENDKLREAVARRPKSAEGNGMSGRVWSGKGRPPELLQCRRGHSLPHDSVRSRPQVCSGFGRAEERWTTIAQGLVDDLLGRFFRSPFSPACRPFGAAPQDWSVSQTHMP